MTIRSFLFFGLRDFFFVNWCPVLYLSRIAEAEEEFVHKSPRLFQLGVALFDALISKSEIVCYFAMIVNHLVTASMLSMLYPLSVFLWAMLSVPRPSKAYWVTMITYTEVLAKVETHPSLRQCRTSIYCFACENKTALNATHLCLCRQLWL